MRGFLSFLRKEWRDARTIAIVCALLAPIALIVTHASVSEFDAPRVAAQIVVPALITLFALVIAADLVAADAASGRAGTYAALPTRPGTSGLAKLAYLGTVVVAFGAWTYAAALLVHLAGKNPGHAWTFIEFVPRSLWVLCFASPLVTAVLLASTLAQRGFTAVCGGCVIVAAFVAVAVAVDWTALEFMPSKGHALVAGLVVGCTLLGGAAVAYVRGPAHAAPLLRRAVLAFAVPVAVLLPTGAATAAVLHDRAQVEVGDPRVTVYPLRWSPDGRHLLLIAARADNPHAIHRVWSLDVRSGAIAPLPVKGMELSSGFAWTDAGARFVESGWFKNPDALVHEFDLATGETVRTRSVEQLESSGKSVFERDDHFASETVEGGLRWTDRRAGGSLFVPDDLTVISTQSMVGRLLLRSNRNGGDLYVGSFDDGTITYVTPGHGSVYLSPGGRYAVATRPDGRMIIDLEHVRVAHRVQPPYGTAFPGGGSPYHVVAYHRDQPTLLIDLRDGTRTPLAPDPNRLGAPWDLVKVRHDGDYALVAPGGRLLLFDAGTGEHRVLYGPRNEE